MAIDDIVSFLSNHLDSSNSLSRVLSVAQNTNSHAFCDQMLSKMQKYKIENGKLPMSFSKENVKALYVELKATD